jgi:hypothetical protein
MAPIFTYLAVKLDGFEDPAMINVLKTDSADSVADATGNLEVIISRVIGAITIVGGLAFLLYFVIGAFEWISAGGDSGKIQKARDKMLQGVTGLVIMVAAYGILGVVGSIVGLDILNPGEAFGELVK